MSQYILKLLITSLIVLLASEISKKNTILAAIIIALPLVSLLTFLGHILKQKTQIKLLDEL